MKPRLQLLRLLCQVLELRKPGTLLPRSLAKNMTRRGSPRMEAFTVHVSVDRLVKWWDIPGYPFLFGWVSTVSDRMFEFKLSQSHVKDVDRIFHHLHLKASRLLILV